MQLTHLAFHPFTAALATILILLTGRLVVLRRRERRKASELSAARRIIDEITREHWILLSEASKAMSSTLDCHQALLRMSELAIPSLADCCVIDLRQDDGTIQRTISRMGTPPRQQTLPSDSEDAISQALLGDQAKVYEGLPEGIRRIVGDSGLTAAMTVPMASRQGTCGAITFGLARPGRQYSNSDLDLARMLTARAALAVENARLYRKEQLAVQARDELAAIVSHELKNPLTAILLKTQIMLRNRDELKAPEQIEAIQSYAKRIDRIVSDLVDLGQLEDGGMAVSCRPEDALTLVTEPIEMMRPLAQTKEIELRAEIPSENRTLHADRNRISQVISNVIGNAVKFAPEQSRVDVKLVYAAEEAKLTITDNGPGIAPESLPHVFERHWQDPKTAHLGSGLGLTVVKGIVELHGGKIGIESEVGSGTTVWFTLPYSVG